MELKDMTIDQLEERQAAIVAELDNDDADLDALEVEARGIKAELENRKAAEAKKAEVRAAVASGEGKVIEKAKVEERKEMSENEIRNSKEYIDAYAEYIKTEDPTECRALLTTNATGAGITGNTVAVPDYVYEITKTAWERDGIMSRVRKAYVQGNLKVGFEKSASPAVPHLEGRAAVDEENLVLGTVQLTPVSIKKWISVSDEALDLRGTAFLDYIYDELTYQIAKAAGAMLVGDIIRLVDEEDGPTVPSISANISVSTIAQALGLLSDEAADPVIIMNKATWSAFKAAQYAAPYAVDPFEGLPVIFCNAVEAYDPTKTKTYAIVGDLGHGALANFPAGEEINIKFDDTTLMTQDLVRILGRMYVGIGVVAPYAFVEIKSVVSGNEGH